MAFLFGGGAGGVTCACDAAGDGITNPPAINGNSLTSLSADDDGGFFKQKSANYYQSGPIPLSGSGPAPTATPTNTTAATSTPTKTPVPATNTPTAAPPTATPTIVPPTSTPVPVGGWTVTASSSKASVSRGARVNLTATVKSGTAIAALVDLEVYSSGGQKVYQRAWDNQSFGAGVSRTFSSQWTVPTSLAPGVYTVKVGIFAPGWAGMFAWNDSAATFTVR